MILAALLDECLLPDCKLCVRDFSHKFLFKTNLWSRIYAHVCKLPGSNATLVRESLET